MKFTTRDIQGNVYENAMYNALEALVLDCTELKKDYSDNFQDEYIINGKSENCEIELMLILHKVLDREDQPYEYIDEDGVMKVTFMFTHKHNTKIEDYFFYVDVKTGQARSLFFGKPNYDSSDLMNCLNLVMEMSK